MTEDSIKTFGTSVPMERAGQPVEVATCFVFLASADSSYIRYASRHEISPLNMVYLCYHCVADKLSTSTAV